MEQQVQKKRIFSGIQPTGNLTLGNYIGALRNFGLLQDEYDCLYSIVDLHALTVRQNPAELRKACLRTMAIFLASGLDPEKNIIYFQSQVPQHAELGWILDNEALVVILHSEAFEGGDHGEQLHRGIKSRQQRGGYLAGSGLPNLYG